MRFALILIGGSGKRFGSDLPKQFIKIGSQELFEYSLQVFVAHPQIDTVILVVHNEFLVHVNEILRKYKSPKRMSIVPAGISRQESVYKGLSFIQNNYEIQEDDLIVIHDGARPLLTATEVDAILNKLHEGVSGVSLAIPSRDTTISLNSNKKINFLDRNNLYCLQTPQGFNLALIKKAHDEAIKTKQYNFSDDLQVLNLLNHHLALVNGDPRNIKVTTGTDILLVKEILFGDTNDG